MTVAGKAATLAGGSVVSGHSVIRNRGRLVVAIGVQSRYGEDRSSRTSYNGGQPRMEDTKPMPPLPTASECPTLTVETAGRYLGISRPTAYEGVRTGDIPSVRVGKRLLVPTAALRRLLELDS